MGRKKSRPIKSGGIVNENSASALSLGDTHLENANSSEQVGTNNNEKNSVCTRTIYIDIDGSAWDATEHFDIAEVILCDVNFYNETVNYGLIKDRFNELKFALRFRLCNVKEGSFRLGQWPILSAADSIFLEYLCLDDHTTENRKNCSILLAGHLDGSDDSVSSLVHLVSLKFLALRPIHVINDFSEVPPLRLRVEVLKNAFEACESLLETVRQPWRKSMMNVVSWLRPEVTTSEAIYGLEGPIIPTEEASRNGLNMHTGFDVASFYEAIKPSREEPTLDEELPELLPCLRPYQLRAAYWMIQREKATDENSGQKGASRQFAPYSVPVVFLDKSSKMFYNPFNGSISMHSHLSTLHVPGGILADEMGLGKTVELLACILAHRRPSLEVAFVCKSQNCDLEREPMIKRQKRERVECICGAASENSKYKGLWVQCDLCDAWQHAQCVGYSLKKNSFVSHENSTKDGSVKVKSKSKFSRKNKGTTDIIEIDGNYICSLCSELIEAAKIDTYTGATLIVCPAPILAQWQSEIMRHTTYGSLKICNYEGARYLNSLITSRTDMMELASADIVLTTYDVLKEDLSHDADRHDGDRHFLRFQKRYPVVPTPLTRIHWWRLCLDEAQMVESNQASVTEMAMRLHAQHRWCITGTPIQRRLDDLYGLLRFLRASPFDVYRWWVEIIRDPYERRDLVAMQVIHNFFKQIMWRSSKLHVAEDLQLPAQEECLSWLTFSAIEEHFYQKQHETCVSHAHEIIKKLKDDHRRRDAISDLGASCYGFLSHSEVAKLVGPLLKLRQACCHPQVGSSGLCALQQNPLTMEEILDVLIGKAKIEGEEAMRKVVSSLNGLAAIAIIEEDAKRAVSLYREALALADENSVDFRLDPLLNLHIHHNLAELIPLTSEFSSHCLSSGSNPLENNQVKKRKETSLGKFEKFYVKRGKRSKNCKPISSRDDSSLTHHNTTDDFNWPCPGTFDNNLKSSEVDGPSSPSKLADSAKIGSEADASCQISSGCYAIGCLRKTCENIKQKYLSVFIMKMSLAQEEFKTSSMQVSSILKELESQSMIWWSHALHLTSQNKESSEELKRKIEQALSGNAQSAGLSRVSSRFRSTNGLLYNIQSSLDSLGSSRQALISRLIEIDQSMENPKDDDIERLRYCPSCYDGDGPLCLHCELDGLFQVYQARLSLVRKASNYTMFESVEEALDMQKRKFELNLFFRNSKSSELTGAGKSKERFVKGAIQVLKIPSELETTLRVIKSHSKTILGKQGMESAKKHLLLFEAMRKEYAQARSLARAQAHVLRAYDEIKMATSRLRLKAAEDDTVAIDVLSKEELIPSSLQLSSEKFVSFSSLQRIKGQLRYLKAMVLSNQIKNHECLDSFSMPQDATTEIFLPSTEESIQQTSHEPCPICHEKIMMQKMVFECGHVICCKCCLRMTEDTIIHSAKNQRKWITCPTCRQRTDFENIAYVDERQNKGGDSIPSNILKTEVESENAITVQGSYGTKIESVIRRILWITMRDKGAKILVFSSWNDVLDVLGHALAANNITFVRMKGGRKSQVAIAQFKGQANMQEGEKTVGPVITPKSVQVLMMLVQHGANGLNLLEAQHVILMEPLLNPAAEAQAISRIHRVGQDKKTFIHRFIVRNTIEDGIYKLNMTRSMSSVISAKASKNQDQPVWTLKDVESLFPMATPSEVHEDGHEPVVRLRDLPPAVAAGLAAQIRLTEGQTHS